MTIENTTDDLDKFEYEIEDDTPDVDKNREKMPAHIAREVEDDELANYDESVQQRFKQSKKMFHDERRDKEAAYRREQEAVNVAKTLFEENKKLRAQYTLGEKEYINTARSAAEIEFNNAKKELQNAHESGDASSFADAQVALNLAQLKLLKAQGLKETPLQINENELKNHQPQVSEQKQEIADPKAAEWAEKNKEWYGPNKLMTAFALGLHEQLYDDGVKIGSNEYYNAIDAAMRDHFPSKFKEESKKAPPQTVVASAIRKTAPNKIKLTQSHVHVAQKLGISVEQYIKELIKMEESR